MGEIDGVLGDVDLALEIGRDVDCGIGDDERLVVAGHVHDEAMADPPRCAQPRVALDHRSHQLVGMEAALHQGFGLAFADQLNRLHGRILAVLGIDDLKSADVEAMLRGDFSDTLFGSDEDRFDELQLGGRERALERHLVAGVRHRDFDRRMRLRSGNQRMELVMGVVDNVGFGLEHCHGRPLLIVGPCGKEWPGAGRAKHRRRTFGAYRDMSGRAGGRPSGSRTDRNHQPRPERVLGVTPDSAR